MIWRILWILSVCWAGVFCVPDFSDYRDFPHNDSIGPFCDVLDEYGIIGCYLINESSVDVLVSSLENATDWEGISLLMAFSAIEDLPSDVFESSFLTSLSFDVNCTLEGVPVELLKHVASPLGYLEFTDVLGLDAIAAGDFGYLEALENLVIQTRDLAEVSDAAFEGLQNLRELTVTGTSVQRLPDLLLQGLDGLDELTITYNPVRTVPKNFFADQSNLRNAWLGQNQLETLEVGSLDGLSNIRMLSVAGNPFNCNCSLEWFKDWLSERDLIEASGATCAYPTQGTFSEVDFCA